MPMKAPRIRLLAGLAAALACAACGNKGALFLPGETPTTATPASTEPAEPGERGTTVPAPPAEDEDDPRGR